MLYRRGLRLKEALELARHATEDFPGLLVLLHPRFRHAPLTDHLVSDGFALIVAGPRGGQPWLEVLRPEEYGALYEAVYRQYAPDEDAEDENGDEGDEGDEGAGASRPRALRRPSP